MMETRDLQEPTLRVTSASMADYLLALANGTTLAEIPLVCIAASLFIPGNGKVILINRGESYTESKWDLYANSQEVTWSASQSAEGDILVLRGVASDTKKAITTLYLVLGVEGTGARSKPFLLIKEGEIPVWKNQSS